MLVKYLPFLLGKSLCNLRYIAKDSSSCPCHNQIFRGLQTFNLLHTNKSSKELEGVKSFILLHDEEDRVLGIKTKKEADDLAKKRKMLLELITPMSSKSKAVYKLTKRQDMKTEGTDIKSSKTKAEGETEIKRIVISSKSQAHDMQTKLRSIKKWLASNHEINLMITLENNRKAAENVLDQIEVTLKPFGARFLQKTINQTRLRVTIRGITNAKAMKDIYSEETRIGGDDHLDDLDKLEGVDVLSDEFVDKLNKSIKQENVKKR